VTVRGPERISISVTAFRHNLVVDRIEGGDGAP